MGNTKSYERSLKFMVVNVYILFRVTKVTLPEGQQLGKSLMKSRKNRGPRTEPWGTPQVMDLVFELQLSMFTYCLRPLR